MGPKEIDLRIIKKAAATIKKEWKIKGIEVRYMMSGELAIICLFPMDSLIPACPSSLTIKAPQLDKGNNAHSGAAIESIKKASLIRGILN